MNITGYRDALISFWDDEGFQLVTCDPERRMFVNIQTQQTIVEQVTFASWRQHIYQRLALFPQVLRHLIFSYLCNCIRLHDGYASLEWEDQFVYFRYHQKIYDSPAHLADISSCPLSLVSEHMPAISLSIPHHACFQREYALCWRAQSGLYLLVKWTYYHQCLYIVEEQGAKPAVCGVWYSPDWCTTGIPQGFINDTQDVILLQYLQIPAVVYISVRSTGASPCNSHR